MGRVLHLGPSWHGPSFMWAELAWAELVLGRVVLHPPKRPTFVALSIMGPKIAKVRFFYLSNIELY